jgi:hypothetical protein
MKNSILTKLEKRLYMIDEVSANHEQNKDFAMSSIDLAVKSGADAVKFQNYTPDSITVNSDLDYFKSDETTTGVANPFMNFKESYNFLDKNIKKYLIKNFTKILNKDIVPIKQIGQGTFHNAKDILPYESKFPNLWDVKISTFLKEVK